MERPLARRLVAILEGDDARRHARDRARDVESIRERDGERGPGRWERWRAFAPSTLARALRLPATCRVIGVGGATLGGSGRTPVALAIVEALVARGHSVALVGHAYGARPRRPRVVRAGDALDEVGDEAAIAAEVLATRAPVVVAPDRQSALDLAAGLASIVVFDRLSQARPDRLHAGVLALDHAAPWGSGRLFPLGDLGHPRAHLREAADLVVTVDGDEAPTALWLEDGGGRRPVDELSHLAFGLVTSAARPERIVRRLAVAGACPRVHVERGDHRPLGAAERARLDRLGARAGIVEWVLDAKTAVRLTSGPPLALPWSRLAHRVTLGARLVDRLEVRCR